MNRSIPPKFKDTDPFLSDYEPVDNTPVQMPTRLRLPQSRTDQIRNFIRQELSQAAADNEAESFEDADDLEPDDESYEPYSPYELADLDGLPNTQIASETASSDALPEETASEAKPPQAESEVPNGT